MSTLYLIPDTNFLIQGRTWDQINWDQLSEFDEITLVICMPVIQEIDRLKSTGNGRRGRQARTWNGKFREFLETEADYQTIRETTPKVKWCIDYELAPSEDTKLKLDLNFADHRIVGCTHNFAQHHPHKAVQLLTNDTGVLIKAKSCNVGYLAVPSGWLRSPERNELEQENWKLRQELKQVKKRQPIIQVAAADENGEEVDSLELTRVRYDELTDEEIDILMNRLKHLCPMTTAFEKEAPVDHGRTDLVSHLARRFSQYIPATEEEIRTYQDSDYPGWLDKCENVFRGLHTHLTERQPPLRFFFKVKNTGTSPAKDVLVTITVKANRTTENVSFGLVEQENCEGDTDSSNDSQRKLCLPDPPIPPRAHWGKLDIVPDAFVRMVSQPEIGRIISNIAKVDTIESFVPMPPDLLLPPRRSPDSFYYDPVETPSIALQLRCKQWFHDPEIYSQFEGQLFFESNISDMECALECRIIAENVTSPIRKIVKVSYSCNVESTLEQAQNLITSLRLREKDSS